MYNNLSVFIIPKERRTNHYMCKPYRFQVTSHGTNITAFVSYRGFKRWLREHNLTLGKRGYYRHGRKILGSYSEKFIEHLPHAHDYSYTLHNGEYVNCAYVYEPGHTIKYVKHNQLGNRQPIEDYRHYEAIFC